MLENDGWMLMFIPDYYKDKKMCDNANHNYAHALGSVPDCYVSILLYK